MVVFLFAGRGHEALSLERARNAIRSLTALAPETAEVQTADGWQSRPLAAVPIGARIRVRTGARVPLDARVDAGHAALDQAPLPEKACRWTSRWAIRSMQEALSPTAWWKPSSPRRQGTAPWRELPPPFRTPKPSGAPACC